MSRARRGRHHHQRRGRGAAGFATSRVSGTLTWRLPVRSGRKRSPSLAVAILVEVLLRRDQIAATDIFRDTRVLVQIPAIMHLYQERQPTLEIAVAQEMLLGRGDDTFLNGVGDVGVLVQISRFINVNALQ
jgi:hypothetical protein